MPPDHIAALEAAMSTTRLSETGGCWDCGGGLTCMHCHPVDRPTQTARIAELEARLSRIHGLALAAQIEIENGDADLAEVNGRLVEIAEIATQT